MRISDSFPRSVRRLGLSTSGRAVLVFVIAGLMTRILAPAAASAGSTVTLHDADPRWVDAARLDVECFAAAGLTPLTGDIHVWNPDLATDACEGYAGYFTNPSSGPRVDLCIDYTTSVLGARLRHQLVLHELAHAWIHTNTPESARVEVAELHGAESWNDPSTPHPARGTELAANTVMRALHPDRVADADELCGYQLLTRVEVPAGLTDPCVGAVTGA